MITVVYADLLFFINLFANCTVLYLTARFSASHTRALKIFLSALVGAIFALFTELFFINGILLITSFILFSFIMCRIAFGKKSIKGTLTVLFFFYFSSIILYGGAVAMCNLMRISGLFDFPPSGFFTIALLIGITAILFTVASKLCSRAARKDVGRVIAKIDDGIRTYELELYPDSGNFAKDPFSGKPVTVVSKSSVSPELYSALTGALSGEINEYCGHLKPRVIPIKSVGGTTLLYAFIPKSMYICDRNGNHEVDSIIAIDSRDCAFFGKDGIIPKILTETI